MGSNLYPNGVCDACGQGLTDDGRCQNDEDSCGNAGQVVDYDLHDQWEDDQGDGPLTCPLDLTDVVHVEAAASAFGEAFDEVASGRSGHGSVLHHVVERLTAEGFEMPTAEFVLGHPHMGALFIDQWPGGTPNYTVVDDVMTPTWKGCRFTPSEMCRWRNVGITDPGLARKLHSGGQYAVRPEMLALRDGPKTLGERVASGEVPWNGVLNHARLVALGAASDEAARIGF